MIKMSEIRKKTDAELQEMIAKAREVVRVERFKDKFSRKVGVVDKAKQEIARALTELSDRRCNNGTK